MNILITTSAISLRNDAWQSESFSAFDAVFHAAGLAHGSVKHVAHGEIS
ncbi:MAG: hypothetical protein II954_12480 [Synergistaceae bacterium]|nr:hypothetical protein [Synergistaceae bacterium]